MRIADTTPNGGNGQAAAHAVPAEALLDMRPLAQPVNALGWMAESLDRADYSTAAEAQQAGQVRDYLRWMAADLPGLTSREPAMLAALSRAAVDAAFRATLIRHLAALDDAVSRAYSRQGGG